MATMDSGAYRREVRMFRGELSNTAARGGIRTLKGAGHQWYQVKAEPTLSLYINTANLYLEAFRNATAVFKFFNEADPVGKRGGIINATTLPFLGSYNSNGPRQGLGFEQNQAWTVTLTEVNNALAAMASGGFGTQTTGTQRTAIGRVVIGLIEAARFTDVQDAIVAGTQLPDRNWDNHGTPAAVFIEGPG